MSTENDDRPAGNGAAMDEADASMSTSVLILPPPVASSKLDEAERRRKHAAVHGSLPEYANALAIEVYVLRQMLTDSI